MKRICPKAGTCIRLPCRKAELHSNCNCHSIDMNCGFPDCPPCIEVSEQENMSCPDNGGNCPVNDANKCLTCPEQKPEKQMREKIAKIIDNAIIADQVDGRFGSEPYADQILSLLNVKSEEEVRGDIASFLRENLYSSNTPVTKEVLAIAIESIRLGTYLTYSKQGKEVKRCTVKKCGLYPEFCPDASNNGSYTTCILMKKEKKKR